VKKPSQCNNWAIPDCSGLSSGFTVLQHPVELWKSISNNTDSLALVRELTIPT
jgi:hypothetical protein